MKIKPVYQILFLIFVALAVYYPAIFAGVNSLDDQHLMQSLLNKDLSNWPRVFFHGSRYNYFRPMVTVSYYADMSLWFLHESFMHLENILLHAWNSIWVYGIAARVNQISGQNQRHPWLPLTAGLLFAVHPIATESVCWISGRSDLLCGAFLFPAVYFLLLGLSRSRWPYSAFGAVLFLFACLSKETAVFVFPAGAFFCFWHWNQQQNKFWRDGGKRFVRYYSPWTAMLLLYFVMRYAAKPRDMGVKLLVKATTGEHYSIVDSFTMFFKAGGFYLKKLIVPWPLNFAILKVSDWYLVLGVVFILLILLWLKRHQLQDMLFLAMACLVSSAMLVPLMNATWTPLAERYAYLATGYFVVACLLAGTTLWQKRSGVVLLTPVVLSLLIGIYAWSTYERCLLWQDNLAFYQDTNKKSPNYPPVLNELAGALFKAGRVEEAQEIYLTNQQKSELGVIEYKPQNKALVLWREGKYEEAGELFWLAAERSYRGRAAILKKYLDLLDKFSLHEDVEAPAWFVTEKLKIQQALYQRTHDPFWLYQQGKSYLQQGDRDQALVLFKEAYQKSKDDVFYKEAARKLVEKLEKER
nr:hypothetical protein [uncultured Desulfuromonas sp.]